MRGCRGIGARRGAGGLVRDCWHHPGWPRKQRLVRASSCYGFSVVLRDGTHRYGGWCQTASCITLRFFFVSAISYLYCGVLYGEIFFVANATTTARCGWQHTHVPRVSRATRCLVGGHVGARFVSFTTSGLQTGQFQNVVSAVTAKRLHLLAPFLRSGRKEAILHGLNPSFAVVD